MPMWNVPGVADEPHITLKPWLILECSNGKRYAMGYNVGGQEGRASTEITEEDVSAKTVRTRSGRLYRLDGPPGLDADARYVWARYAAREGLTAVKDISADLWPGYDPGQCPLIDTRIELIREALRSSPADSSAPGDA
jgi:hypothetical protein